MRHITPFALLIASVLSLPVHAAKIEQTDDILPMLVDLFKNPKAMEQKVEIVGELAQGLLGLAHAKGPIYATAKPLNKIKGPGGCMYVGVMYEIHQALLSNGARATANVVGPVPVCPDGQPPKMQLAPDEMAFAHTLVQKIQKELSQTQQSR